MSENAVNQTKRRQIARSHKFGNTGPLAQVVMIPEKHHAKNKDPSHYGDKHNHWVDATAENRSINERSPTKLPADDALLRAGRRPRYGPRSVNTA